MTVWWYAAFAAAAMGGGMCGWFAGRRGRRPGPARRARLAHEQNAEGERLLQMAAEMDRHARTLERLGLPGHRARHWARACRQAAVRHLACINALLLDADDRAGWLVAPADGLAPGGEADGRDGRRRDGREGRERRAT